MSKFALALGRQSATRELCPAARGNAARATAISQQAYACPTDGEGS